MTIIPTFHRFAIFLSIYANCDKINENKKFTNPHDAISLPFRKMIIDKISGNVYLGATNYLYHLNSDLKPISSFKTGPIADSVQCSLTERCIGEVETNNYAKAMVIDNTKNKLIFCGSVRQGICRMHNIQNVSLADEPINIPMAANDKDSSSIIFIAPAHKDTNALYTATTYTDSGPHRDSIPAIAIRHLMKGTAEMFKPITTVQFKSTVRKTYKVDYIYGFTFVQYIYIVSRQRVSTKSQDYESKLIRTCSDNCCFPQIYYEMPIECTDGNGRTFNLIQDAYLSHPKNATDAVLYGVFAESDETEKSKPKQSSAVCSFSLKEVEKNFVENIHKCIRGEVMRGLDFLQDDAMCTKGSSFSPCGGHAAHSIGITVSTRGKFLFVDDNNLLTSIVSTIAPYTRRTVIVVGTESGLIKRLTIPRNKPVFQYDIESYSYGPILDLGVDQIGQNIYVLTTSTVQKISLIDCDRYGHSCSNCVSYQDPFCGWCKPNNICTPKYACSFSYPSQWLANDASCIEIKSITPRQIPVEQSTKITLDVTELSFDNRPFLCTFVINGLKLTTPAIRANDSSISCDSPKPESLLQIIDKSNMINGSLSVKVDNYEYFASMNLTFYDCSMYTVCHDCVLSTFACSWCADRGRCLFKSATCSKFIKNTIISSKSVNNQGAQQCPLILPIGDQSEIYLPLDSARGVELRVRNVMDSYSKFLCRFTLESTKIWYDVAGVLNRANNTVHCVGMNSLYAHGIDNKASAFLNVTYWDQHNEHRTMYSPVAMKVHMFKCTAEKCENCLKLNKNYECGWCKSINKCTTYDKCSFPGSLWSTKYETTCIEQTTINALLIPKTTATMSVHLQNIPTKPAANKILQIATTKASVKNIDQETATIIQPKSSMDFLTSPYYGASISIVVLFLILGLVFLGCRRMRRNMMMVRNRPNPAENFGRIQIDNFELEEPIMPSKL